MGIPPATLFYLKMVTEAIADLATAFKDKAVPLEEELIENVEQWMNYLFLMVHESKIFQAHMQALDVSITNAMKFYIPERDGSTREARSEHASGCNSPPKDAQNPQNYAKSCASVDQQQVEKSIDEDRPADKADVDTDGGLTDTALELTAAQTISRVAQQSLWLAVSYQQAAIAVTHRRALPKTPISLTLWEPPASAVNQNTHMELWRELISSMYPRRDAGPEEILTSMKATTGKGIQHGNITAEEAIEALECYGEQHYGRVTLFTPNGEAKCRFRGAYHAECILGTMAYLGGQLGLDSGTTPLPSNVSQEELRRFRLAFGTIGVTKRCCPICTKLLSLLSSRATATIGPTRFHNEPLKVLCAHQNIYPTSLPSLVPDEVAAELVCWLECLLRILVEGLVNKQRRMTAASVKSSDSKGDSPNKAVEKERKVEGVGAARKAANQWAEGRTRKCGIWGVKKVRTLAIGG